jgi:hypothetical protein
MMQTGAIKLHQKLPCACFFVLTEDDDDEERKFYQNDLTMKNTADKTGGKPMLSDPGCLRCE